MSGKTTAAKATVNRTAIFLGNAAAKAKKQAELVALNTVTLPRLYHAVGKHLLAAEKLPPDLEQHRTLIRQLEARNTAAPVKAMASSGGELRQGGLAAKAASLARGAAEAAVKAGGDAARTAQIQAEYVSLGKAAVEKYGDKALPSGELEKYQAAVARRDRLVAELSDGESGKPSWALRYVGFAVALVGVLGIVTVGRSLLPGGAVRPPTVTAPQGQPDWLVYSKEDAEADREWRHAKTIDERTARQAVSSGNDLVFSSLRTLTPKVAAILAGARSDLSFPSLPSITPQVAEALATHRGGESRTGIGPLDSLGLQGLRELPDGVASELASHRGELSIGTEARPIARLSDSAAAALGRSQARVLELYVEQISKAGQDALAAYGGDLALPSLVSIDSTALLGRLCKGKRPEVALAVKSLTLHQALCLVDSRKDLRLNKLETVSPEVGEVLSLSRRDVMLLGLKKAPEAALKVLRTNPRVSLP
jgi:hypothetical protein